MTEIKPAPKEQKPVTGGKMPTHDNSVDMAKLAEDESMPTREDGAGVDEAKPEEGVHSEETAAPPEEAPMDGQAPATEENFDAKTAIEGLSTGLEETNARISRIEEVLDKLAEEEADEPEHAGEEATEAGKLDGEKESAEAPAEEESEEEEPAAKKPPGKPEKPEEKKEAEHSKEISELRGEVATLKAQFAKMANTGVRKTQSSSSGQTDPDMQGFDRILAGMDISKSG